MLVQTIAVGDQRALHALPEDQHPGLVERHLIFFVSSMPPKRRALQIIRPLPTRFPEAKEWHSGQNSKTHKVMSEHKHGTLKSGSGKKVKSRKAIAIAISESGQSQKHKKTS